MATASQNPNRPLTYKQSRFVEEYLLDPKQNATTAAKRAGYSINTATETGYQLLKTAAVQKAIEESNEATAKSLGITRERILQELLAIGLSNLKHIVTQDEQGNTDVNLAHLDDGIASPITEISVSHKKGKRDVRVKTADKQAALVSIMKLMGWSNEKLEITGKVSLEQLIEESFKPTGSETEADNAS